MGKGSYVPPKIRQTTIIKTVVASTTARGKDLG